MTASSQRVSDRLGFVTGVWDAMLTVVNAAGLLWEKTTQPLLLYALVVAGPFLLIAALLLLAERTRRRRADHRLLEETG